VNARERIEALPRFALILQDRAGWTRDRGHEAEPVLVEAVVLADVLAAVDAPGETEDASVTL